MRYAGFTTRTRARRSQRNAGTLVRHGLAASWGVAHLPKEGQTRLQTLFNPGCSRAL